jgi:glycosyltransferase involved in cell wall biosynthesis
MWNYAMAGELARQGHEVTVVAARHQTAAAATHRAGARIVRLLARDFSRWRRLPALGRYARFVTQMAYAAQVNQTLRALYRQRPFDVVEFAEVNAEGYFYARKPPATVVVRCHTPNFVLRRYYTRREMPFDTARIGACEQDLIRRARALTAPSHDMARVIEAECSLSPSVVRVIPNALNLGELPAFTETPVSAEPIILHVGRLERVKGVEVLVAAIPAVLQQIPAARFVFVGADRHAATGGSQRAALETALQAAGARDQVIFTGEVEQTALWEWYARASVCVVPSMLYESFSYTCAQAMALGKPLVATRIGGIPETVGDGGLIVEPGDPVSLAATLTRLLRDPALCQQLGRAARAKAERDFAAPVVAQQVLAVYQQALSGA